VKYKILLAAGDRQRQEIVVEIERERKREDGER
jgi:hypothetical protein